MENSNSASPSEFSDLWDLAYVLTQDYNGIGAHLIDSPPLSEAWVHAQLADLFELDDIEILAESDFGRGIIMGVLRFRYAIHELESEDE